MVTVFTVQIFKRQSLVARVLALTVMSSSITNVLYVLKDRFQMNAVILVIVLEIILPTLTINVTG